MHDANAATWRAWPPFRICYPHQLHIVTQKLMMQASVWWHLTWPSFLPCWIYAHDAQHDHEPKLENLIVRS